MIKNISVNSRSNTRNRQMDYEISNIFKEVKEDESPEAQAWYNSEEYYQQCIREMEQASKEIEANRRFKK